MTTRGLTGLARHAGPLATALCLFALESSSLVQSAFSAAPARSDVSVTPGQKRNQSFQLEPSAKFHGSEAEFQPVVALDPAKGEWPAGLAVDAQGNLYVALIGLDQIRQVTLDGAVKIFAQLPAPARRKTATTLGLAFAPSGHLYVTRSSADPATHGIWRVSPDGKISDRFAALPPGFPNALAFDKSGNLYVSDSAEGQLRIWKIETRGKASAWKTEPRRPGNDAGSAVNATFGANGIAFDRSGKSLYVASTDSGRIQRIPLNGDGTAGDSVVFAQSEQLIGADGIAFDLNGNLFVTVNRADRLVVISPQGCLATIAEGEPLQHPASLVIGVSGNPETLWIANLAVMESPGLTKGTPLAGLMRLRKGERDLLRPAAEVSSTREVR